LLVSPRLLALSGAQRDNRTLKQPHPRLTDKTANASRTAIFTSVSPCWRPPPKRSSEAKRLRNKSLFSVGSAATASITTCICSSLSERGKRLEAWRMFMLGQPSRLAEEIAHVREDGQEK